MIVGFIIGAIISGLFVGGIATMILHDLCTGHDAIVRRLDKRIASLRAAVDRLREVAK